MRILALASDSNRTVTCKSTLENRAMNLEMTGTVVHFIVNVLSLTNLSIYQFNGPISIINMGNLSSLCENVK